MTPLKLRVFGKPGCAKCDQLKKRLGKLLADPRWEGIGMEVQDLSTVEGLVNFAEAECLNPQRIPALLVLRENDGAGWQPLPSPAPGAEDAVCGKSRLYSWIGLQTDYSEAGKGLITPAMLESVLEDARRVCA